MSFDGSPGWFVLVAAEVLALPKRPDILLSGKLEE